MARLDVELRRLDDAVLGQSARVEDAVRRAVRALSRRDAAEARAVAAADRDLDRREAEIEEECLKIIALHQPVAGPLRHLIGVVKMNLSLERTGDLAVHLARKARTLAALPPVAEPPELAPMAERAVQTLHEVISAFVARDAAAARAVASRDKDAERRKRAVRLACEAALQARPDQARQQMAILGAARNLERVAGMGVYLSRCVAYALEGDFDPPGGDGGDGPPWDDTSSEE